MRRACLSDKTLKPITAYAFIHMYLYTGRHIIVYADKQGEGKNDNDKKRNSENQSLCLLEKCLVSAERKIVSRYEKWVD